MARQIRNIRVSPFHRAAYKADAEEAGRVVAPVSQADPQRVVRGWTGRASEERGALRKRFGSPPLTPLMLPAGLAEEIASAVSTESSQADLME